MKSRIENSKILIPRIKKIKRNNFNKILQIERYLWGLFGIFSVFYKNRKHGYSMGIITHK